MRVLGTGHIAMMLLVAILSPLTPAQAADGVKIGVLADMSGPLAEIGGQGSAEAVKMAVEDFGGQVLGKPIEIVTADGQNRRDVAVTIARNWYDSGVDVITDIPTSDVALAVMQLAGERKKIALVTSAGSSDITGKFCSPYAAHWTWDTYAMSHGTVDSIMRRGGKEWFFITADYVFGQALERDAAAVVVANGGRVHGAVRHSLGILDFSSFFLQAQGSRANIVGLANAGSDTINAVKQAIAFGLPQGGTQLVALITFINDIHAIGLKDAQGLMLTEAFYWDLDEATRAWSHRFFARTKRMPSMTQAGAYSAVLHYLKAVQAAGTRDADQVMAQMRAMPINDVMTRDGKLRIDGRVLRDMYLFRVKKPAESRSDWDLYKLVAKIPAEQAFRPLSEGGCPLVK